MEVMRGTPGPKNAPKRRVTGTMAGNRASREASIVMFLAARTVRPRTAPTLADIADYAKDNWDTCGCDPRPN